MSKKLTVTMGRAEPPKNMEGQGGNCISHQHNKSYKEKWRGASPSTVVKNRRRMQRAARGVATKRMKEKYARFKEKTQKGEFTLLRNKPALHGTTRHKDPDTVRAIKKFFPVRE